MSSKPNISQKKKFEVVFTPEAEQTYQAISEQIRERWGDQVVLNLQDKIEKCMLLISNSPLIYSIMDKPTEVRRCILHKNCSLLYKIFDQKVVVICFWDNRQEPIFTARDI